MPARLLLPLLALALLAQPAVAAAAVGQTNVTKPEHPTYRTVANTYPNVTVEGDAPGAANGDKVDLWCIYGTSDDTFVKGDVAVSSQKFATTVGGNQFNEGTCRLIAVPDATDVATANLSPYGGPLVTTEYRQDYRTAADAEGSPNVLYDYLFAHQQARGLFSLLSVNSCGICSSRLFYADTARSSEYVFWDNGYLRLSESAPFDRSSARVDGHNAWGSRVADLDIGDGDKGDDLEGVPPVTYSASGGGQNEDLTVDEAEDLVRCEKGDPWPVNRAGCGKFVPSGVRFERRAQMTREGTLLTFTDVFRSTDGAAHQLDLRWTERFKHTTMSFQFPWKDDAYTTYGEGASVPGTGPGSAMFFRTKHGAPDGDRSWPQGALVYDAPIGKIDFIEVKEFRFPTALTVPAGGSVTLRHAYAMATTRAELVEVMTPIEDLYVPPAVAITAPDDGARTSEREVEVRGTASDNKGVAGVTLNGRPATVAGDGTWSGRVTLEVGSNTITATARDAAGNERSASRTVVLEPPQTVCCTPRPDPPLSDKTAPVLSDVALSARRFRAAGLAAATPVGTRVRFTLSEPATVRFTIVRAVAGRRSRGRCRAPSRALRGRPRCTRLKRLGVLSRTAAAGPSRLRFTGRLSGKALRPRAYRMLVRATDAAGNRSRNRTLRFRIVRR